MVIKKLKKIRGLMYRRFVEKKKIPRKMTRTGQLLVSLKKEHEETFPKFSLIPTRSLINLPSTKETNIKNIIYPVIKPYAYIGIRYDEADHELTYNVLEPVLNEREIFILKKLSEGFVQIIDVTLEDIKHPEKIIKFLESSIQRLIYDYNLSLNRKEYLKIFYYIYRDFVGFNRIEPMLNDPYIEDVGCDGLNIPVYVVHKKFGSIKTNIVYKDEEELRNFVIKLAERCDRYISYAEPLLDGTLKDGSRIQASLAGDVTTRGPTFSIRKFSETPFTPVDMIRLGTVSPEMLAYLWFVVEHGSNILITGGVSTGKTTMLNTISLFIPDEAKIVSIEDTRELNLPHENWIPSVSRIGFTVTGVGEITMFKLLRESFRQNPDYLIVGEVRGKEAYVMFQGMASGHPSISTMHAGSIDDLMKRLRTRPISLSPGLLDSLNIVVVMIHAREKGKSARRVKEIVEIESVDIVTGQPRTNKVFLWLPAEDNFEYKGNSYVLSKISRAKGIPMSKIVLDITRRKKLINWLYQNNVTRLEELVKYINLYRRTPESLESIVNSGLKENKIETNHANFDNKNKI